ncbi:MAG: DoxX family membrane protein [Streptosporangiales bacterium]|nr:DoxX family membrane protein [Streptosporangiales bacterium]
MRRSMYDILALVARVGVGAVFIAHGWQKTGDGIDATGAGFAEMGVPYPAIAAGYATFVELIGGAALIVGIGLPLFGLLLAADMAGAFVFVHAQNGIFVSQNGFELVLALGLASLLLGFGGSGRLTLDNLIFGRRRETRAVTRDGESEGESESGRAEPDAGEGPAETPAREPTSREG